MCDAARGIGEEILLVAEVRWAKQFVGVHRDEAIECYQDEDWKQDDEEYQYEALGPLER